MPNKIFCFIQQRLLTEKLTRKPEMDMIMLDREQDEEYTRAGEKGPLAILYDFVINTLLRISPLSGEALDIACGSAQLLCKIAQAMPQIHFTGVDISPRMLEFAAETQEKYRVPNVDFQRADMYRLDQLFDRKFDLITWCLAMHHCDSEENVVKVFNQMTGLLREGGTLFVFDIERPKTGHLALAFAEVYNQGFGDWFFHDSLDSYKAAFTFQEVEQLLSCSNLKNPRHVDPLMANFFQVIYVSSIWRSRAPQISNLKFLWQKMDYFFMHHLFEWRFRQLEKSRHG